MYQHQVHRKKSTNDKLHRYLIEISAISSKRKLYQSNLNSKTLTCDDNNRIADH